MIGIGKEKGEDLMVLRNTLGQMYYTLPVGFISNLYTWNMPSIIYAHPVNRTKITKKYTNFETFVNIVRL